MVKRTFPNNYRHPMTGKPHMHLSTVKWLEKLGLTDHEGTPVHSENTDFYNKYGPTSPEHPNQQMALMSDSGDHEYDQAATYLGQQSLQQGRTWFPGLGPSVEPDLAVMAAQKLREQQEGHSAKTAEVEHRDNDAFQEYYTWRPGDLLQDKSGVQAIVEAPMDENGYLYMKHHDPTRRFLHHQGFSLAAPAIFNYGFQKIDPLQAKENPWGYDTETPDTEGQMDWMVKNADLVDPTKEPDWMGDDSDIQMLNAQNLCAKCGRPDCEHKGDHVHPPIHPKGMEVHPMWQQNSSPGDAHGDGY